ncbi:hypothetical protein HK104_003555, partial [Borealophlyctis nickersoniae]
MLQQAGITKQEQAANPQAVIDIIGFYSEASGGKLMDEQVWSKFNNPYAKQVNPEIGKGGMAGTKSPTTSPRGSPEGSPKLAPRPKLPATEPKKRPPVPARPAHTLSIYSTDIKPVVPEKPAQVAPQKPA